MKKKILTLSVVAVLAFTMTACETNGVTIETTTNGRFSAIDEIVVNTTKSDNFEEIADTTEEPTEEPVTTPEPTTETPTEAPTTEIPTTTPEPTTEAPTENIELINEPVAPPAHWDLSWSDAVMKHGSFSIPTESQSEKYNNESMVIVNVPGRDNWYFCEWGATYVLEVDDPNICKDEAAHSVRYDYAYGMYVNSEWEKIAKDLLWKDSEGKKTEADIVTFEHDGKKGYYLVYDETEESRKFYVLQDIGFDVFAQITIDTKDVSTAPNELVEEYLLNLPLNITVPTAFDVPAELAKFATYEERALLIGNNNRWNWFYNAYEDNVLYPTSMGNLPELYFNALKDINTGENYIWGANVGYYVTEKVFGEDYSSIEYKCMTAEEFEAQYGSIDKFIKYTVEGIFEKKSYYEREDYIYNMLQLGEYSVKYESLKSEYVSIDEEANLKITYYVDVVKEIDTGNEYVWGVRRTEQTYKSVGLSSIKPSRPSTIEEFEAEYGSLEEILAKIK